MPLLFYRLSDSFVSLSYLFRVGRTTISEIVLDGCEAGKQVSTRKQHAVVFCGDYITVKKVAHRLQLITTVSYCCCCICMFNNSAASSAEMMVVRCCSASHDTTSWTRRTFCCWTCCSSASCPLNTISSSCFLTARLTAGLEILCSSHAMTFPNTVSSLLWPTSPFPLAVFSVKYWPMAASEVSSSLNAFDFRLADAWPATIGFYGSHDVDGSRDVDGCGSLDVDGCGSLDVDGDGSALHFLLFCLLCTIIILSFNLKHIFLIYFYVAK